MYTRLVLLKETDPRKRQVFGSNVAPRRRIFPARRTAWTCPACRKDNPKWAGNCLRCYTKAPHG